MKSTRNVAVILALAVAFCFVLASFAQATDTKAGRRWANNNLENKNKAVGIPIWKITRPGTSKSVNWVHHTPNPRFAIYDPATPADESDDVVLDKETGLVWARDANLLGERAWTVAFGWCRQLIIGSRTGWRVPTVEELSSLVDPSQTDPALPSGHPFKNVQFVYWSSTTDEIYPGAAWEMHTDDGFVGPRSKSVWNYVWPVRGGSGPILVPHTPTP